MEKWEEEIEEIAKKQGIEPSQNSRKSQIEELGQELGLIIVEALPDYIKEAMRKALLEGLEEAGYHIEPNEED